MRHRLRIASLVLCWLCVAPLGAQAMELTLNMGLGLTVFRPTTPDGTWWQDCFPHSFRPLDVGFKTGIGVRLNEQWSVDTNYVRLGAVTATTKFVFDEDYDLKSKQCKSNCTRVYNLRATDTMQGGEILLKRTFNIGPVRPFLQVGAGAVYHTVVGLSDAGNAWYAGWMPIAVGGVGACYQWACAEVNYYHAFGGGESYPISKDAVLPMFTVRVPL